MDKEDMATLAKVGMLVLGGFAVMFFLIAVANLI
tara:strand:- start:16198 stop:16299 length:102 start_codon:yes stop_codon:yes gene_type:complete